MEDARVPVQNVRQAVIVGGSLAGLLVGVVLKTLPQIESVTILERSEPERLKDQGAGIRLGPEVVETLRKYASFPLETYAEPLDTYRLLSEGGGDFLKSQINDWCTNWSRIFSALRQVFEEPSKYGVKGSYCTGCNVTGVVDEGSRVNLEFETAGGHKEACSADLLLGADGASSSLRHLVEPGSKRSYVGYVALRGTVPSTELSEGTQDTFHRAGAFFFPQDSPQALAYTVPSSEQNAGKSSTCLNWVWYQPKTESELADLMTDTEGMRHPYTLPMGSMREEVIQTIKERASKGLAPQIAEAIQKTAQPFVQAITDNIAGQNCFFGGKMLLVGDAAAGQRPHTASATAQASLHAILVKSLLLGEMSVNEWSKETRDFSTILIDSGRELGRILVTAQLPPQERTQVYTQEYLATQAKLSAKWKSLIGSNPKI